jgi:hypothetical protein
MLLVTYQLEKQVIGNPSKQVDLVHKRVEKIMWNAWTDGFWKGIKSLLLLQPLWICPELQAQMCKHLIL